MANIGDKVSIEEAVNNVLALELDDAVEERIAAVLEKVLVLPKYREMRERIAERVATEKSAMELEAYKQHMLYRQQQYQNTYPGQVRYTQGTADASDLYSSPFQSYTTCTTTTTSTAAQETTRSWYKKILGL